MPDPCDRRSEPALPRRHVLRLAGAAAGVLAFPGLSASSAQTDASLQPPAPPWNHDPTSLLGPGRWDAIGYPTCGSGVRQSPVDIDTAAVTDLDGPALVASYGCSELAVENTRHTRGVIDPGGRPGLGDDTYRLVQYHFHAPSEHRIDGLSADVEAHFVHQNSRGGVAVVGALFHIGPKPNPLLTRILLSAPVTVGHEAAIGEVSPAGLVPGVDHHVDAELGFGSFYTYRGSLTTPDCAKDVRWFLLADAGQVSAAAGAAPAPRDLPVPGLRPVRRQQR